MADHLEFVQAMSVLSIEPGDMLVFKSAVVLSAEQAERLREQLRTMVGDYPIMILDKGMEIGVLRKVDDADTGQQ